MASYYLHRLLYFECMCTMLIDGYMTSLNLKLALSNSHSSVLPSTSVATSVRGCPWPVRVPQIQ